MDDILLTSPFEAFPGSITVPAMLDAATYQDWYDRVGELNETEDEKRHSTFQVWDCRFPFIIDHDIQLGKDRNGKPYEIERTGLRLPSPAIAAWIIEETEFLLDDAQDPKNSLAPSNNTSNTTPDSTAQ